MVDNEDGLSEGHMETNICSMQQLVKPFHTMICEATRSGEIAHLYRYNIPASKALLPSTSLRRKLLIKSSGKSVTVSTSSSIRSVCTFRVHQIWAS